MHSYMEICKKSVWKIPQWFDRGKTTIKFVNWIKHSMDSNNPLEHGLEDLQGDDRLEIEAS